MQMSKKAWLEYIRKMRAISEEAASQMEKFVQVNGFGDNKALLDYAMALTNHYGEAAGTLACEMYEATAEAQGIMIRPAEPAPIPEYGEVAKAINGTLKFSQKMVPKTVGRMVKQVGADTTLKNAIRDGAEFAWVPHGDTCAFCITLASRGWQKVSKHTLKNGHAEHIHPNCDCNYTVRFDGKSSVEGYDPDKYLDMYNSAAPGGKPDDKIKALRRSLLKEQENSNKQRKKLEQTTLVDLQKIKSNEFRDKLDSLTENVDERRDIHKAAIDIMEHRTGTRYEDLAFINTRNGKIIINKDYDYYEDGISACKPNKPMLKMLGEEAEGMIIAVHNHPGSGAPSKADIMAAKERKYKYGVVICHNQTVYKYTLSDDFVYTLNTDFSLAKLENAKYNNSEKDIQDAIKEMETAGLKIEVI